MQTFKNHSKYFIIAALTLTIVGGVFAQVSIPTGLTNAVQYIRDTIWTNNGTNAGTVNVKIDPNFVYIRTGFLADGTGWNNKALGLDSSGNVVYVNANAINNPLLFPTANYIPKVNATQDGFDVSTMYQTGGLIGVNTTNPIKSVDIFGDFQVTTLGSNVQYQYNYHNNNVAIGYPAVDITTAPICSVCDINPTTNDCGGGGSFIAPSDYGTYCIDATNQVNGNDHDHDIYLRQIIGVPDPVLVTLGTNVGIGTNNPIADLHVSGSGFAIIETGTITKQLSILDDTLTFQTPIGGLQFTDYSGIKKLTLSTLGTNVTPDVLINPSRGCMLVIFGNCVRYIQPPKVGIGLNNPSQMLEVAGSVRANGVILSSDESLKENITPITNALSRIQNIQGIYYTWINNSLPLGEDESPIGTRENNWNLGEIANSNPAREWPTGMQIGFSAQDIQDAFGDVPSMVSVDNNGVLGVNYMGIIPVLVEAIKEQQTIIEDLEFRLSNLEGGPIE